MMMEGITETNINQSNSRELGIIDLLHRALLYLKQNFVEGS